MPNPRFPGAASLSIRTKRAYEPLQPADGTRILVDRLWPRGISKTDLAIDYWLKEIAPSNDLRRWFGHKAERWNRFIAKYFGELDSNPTLWQPLLEMVQRGPVTLLYAAKDAEHNNAEALRLYLNSKLDESAGS